MSWFSRLRSAPLPLQLLALAAVFVLIGAVLTFVYVKTIRSQYGVLFANLRPQDAATIVAELDKQKVPYRIENDGSTILAPQEQVPKLRLELMNTELPLKGTVGFELFNKSDMGLTEFAQQINYQRALQGELARTIMSLANVTEARVHLALPEHTIFAADRQPPKASVILTTKDASVPGAGVVKGIQRLVAAAVPDLKIDDVVVIDGRGGIISGPSEASFGFGPALSPAVNAGGDDRGYLEQAYQATVQQALQISFPDKQFDVAVWVKTGLLNVSLDTLAPQDARDFSLSVAVTPMNPTDQAGQNAIRNVVNAAIQAGPQDVVIVHPAAAASSPEPQARSPDPVFKKGLPIQPADVRSMIIGLGVVLIGVALFGLKRRDGRRAMSAAKRQRYATRLRMLLQAEG